jgi:hypothetical protein
MNIVCIDPGIVSVGIFAAIVCAATGQVSSIIMCANVNVMTLDEAHYSDGVYGYVSGFIQKYKLMFDRADKIVIERQPLQSAGTTLEVIFRERYPDVCAFISPNSIHKRFDIRGYTYDGRKMMSVHIVKQALTQWSNANVPNAADALTSISGIGRHHDCCDACLIFILYVERFVLPVPTTISNPFHEFMYIPKPK